MMFKKCFATRMGLLRVGIPGGVVFVLGGCGLSDTQLTSIATSLVTTGLNTLVTQAIAAFFGAAGA